MKEALQPTGRSDSRRSRSCAAFEKPWTSFANGGERCAATFRFVSACRATTLGYLVRMLARWPLVIAGRPLPVFASLLGRGDHGRHDHLGPAAAELCCPCSSWDW
jgi:hypothetical protein